MDYQNFVATFSPDFASDELIAQLLSKRVVRFAQPGSDDERMLDHIGAAGSFAIDLTGTSILLRLRPLKISVLEEFLHGTQYKLGLWAAWGRLRCEVHVKKFLLRNKARAKLSRNDVKAITYLEAQEVARLKASRNRG